ncbi:hypothetical protein A3770_02p12700 [Chloropicon primus]|uniref:Uncharacterized protein n=1 Tax=Chloropicon primus TaxID=1764295 RepID=A0A5B8MHB9_9CHLO|nr:hypothetical protein A3770_02p12700 [Chloropicon primus]|eukprot:QDZ18752.1 hypothetical protein A3770_02p12700 [Chloropicon primus]
MKAKDKKMVKDLGDESPFKAKGYMVVKQWSFEDSKFKRVARPDIYKSSMNKSFYEVIVEERERKKKEKELLELEKAGDMMHLFSSKDENGDMSRPHTAMPSPSYMQPTGLNTKVWSKRPFSARCENPGHHTPRKPFFTKGSKTHTSKFMDKAEERIVYFHELDKESKVVQSRRFMLERVTGTNKNRTLSRPQFADTWRRHHYQSNRTRTKLRDILTIQGMEMKHQPSF